MINEHKKNRRAVKYNIKPRNFVAKNATTSGAGEHRDKSKEIARKAKHKNREMDMAEDDGNSPAQGSEEQRFPHYTKFKNTAFEVPDDDAPEGSRIVNPGSDEWENIYKQEFDMPSPKDTGGFQIGNHPLVKAPSQKDVAEGERTMSRAAKGMMKYGEKGMRELAKKGKEGASEKEMDATRNKFNKYNESLLREDIMGAPRPEDNHEASMALSELYRNAKYAMALLKIIEPNDAIDGWVQANLTSAADMLDKVGHYLDYKNINGRKPEVDMDEDDNVDDADPGETDGSMARENLEMIVEYSIRLMEMIKPGDNLASWVSMKLTKASEAISSAKHFIEYRNFEKHASDAFESKLTRLLAQQLSETMMPTSSFVGSKKNKLGSAGQLKGNMKRAAKAGDLVGGGAAESVSEDDEAMRNFLAKGGKIQHLKPQKGPKTPGLSYASKHIGAAGGRGSSKGKVSGLGAATGKSNKPVVTAEEEQKNTDNKQKKTMAKTWDEMTSQEKLSGVKGRTVWNPKTQKYRTVFDVPAQSKK
jgi:hypothetical protein